MNIYVGNLSYDVSDVDLENAFGKFGDVNSVKVIKDHETGRSRGFGFVEMRCRDEGNEAIESLNYQNVDGRNMVVNEARPRENTNRQRLF